MTQEDHERIEEALIHSSQTSTEFPIISVYLITILSITMKILALKISNWYHELMRKINYRNHSEVGLKKTYTRLTEPVFGSHVGMKVTVLTLSNLVQLQIKNRKKLTGSICWRINGQE